MAVCLEAAGNVETWISEHSGRRDEQTNAGVDAFGKPNVGPAQQRLTDHENTDYAEERKGLQVGALYPVVNIATASGPQMVTGEQYAKFLAFQDFQKAQEQKEAQARAAADAENQRKYQEFLASQAADVAPTSETGTSGIDPDSIKGEVAEGPAGDDDGQGDESTPSY